MTTVDVSVVPVLGAEVKPGDRLVTEHGVSSPITHFKAAPAGSFAAQMYGEGVRIPYAGPTPLARPLGPSDLVAVQARSSSHTVGVEPVTPRLRQLFGLGPVALLAVVERGTYEPVRAWPPPDGATPGDLQALARSLARSYGAEYVQA